MRHALGHPHVALRTPVLYDRCLLLHPERARAQCSQPSPGRLRHNKHSAVGMPMPRGEDSQRLQGRLWEPFNVMAQDYVHAVVSASMRSAHALQLE